MDTTKLHLKEGEELILAVHGSLLALAPKIALAFVWLGLPFFLLFPLFHMRTFGVILFVILLLTGGFYAYRLYKMWSDTVFFVTDQRVVDFDRPGLTRHVVSEASLNQIREISYEIDGFWATILRYGTLNIQIRGSEVDLTVFNVRHPSKIQELIHEVRTP